MTPEPVSFTVFSDFLCPWCYVGAVRLQRAQERHGDRLRVEWKSYLLRPDPTRPDLERFRAYAQGWRRQAQLEPRATFRLWDTDTQPPGHSLPAAAAAKLAASYGAEGSDRYRHALFAAYFTDNRTISDRGVLAAVAGECGLPAEDFGRRLDEEWAEHVDAVFDDFSDALEVGVTAVPAVVVDDDFVLRGAVEDADYDDAVTRALAVR